MPSRSEMKEDLDDLKEAIELFDEARWGESHPAYAAVRKEIDVLERRLAGEVDLRTKSMIAAHHGDGLAYGAQKRSEIADFLTAHRTYYSDGRSYISWNIKLSPGIEATSDQFDFDSRFDDRWDALLQNDPRVFDEAVENVLRRYVEGEYTAADDARELKATFSTAGRSGGHLILTRFELPDHRGGRRSIDMSAGSDGELARWIADEMEDDEIVALYALVVSVDADVEAREALVSDELGYQRSLREEDWAHAPSADDEEEADTDFAP